MHQARAHRSRKVSIGGTRSGAATFETFGIFERDRPMPAFHAFLGDGIADFERQP